MGPPLSGLWHQGAGVIHPLSLLSISSLPVPMWWARPAGVVPGSWAHPTGLGPTLLPLAVPESSPHSRVRPGVGCCRLLGGRGERDPVDVALGGAPVPVVDAALPFQVGLDPSGRAGHCLLSLHAENHPPPHFQGEGHGGGLGGLRPEDFFHASRGP